MPQLRRSSSASRASRASRVLPTVTCSSCALPVPLAALGEHVCPPLPPPATAPPSPAPPSRPPPPAAASLPPRPQDYMPGGASGMAGVGRRAFQAAAHAAVLAQHRSGPSLPETPRANSSRRSVPPQFLDTGATGRGTPPLSPNSSQSSPPSRSPLSPLPQSRRNAPAIAASPPPASRVYSPTRSPPPDDPSTPTASRLPFLERYKNTLGQLSPTSQSPPSKDPFYSPRRDRPRPPSPTDSEASSVGLAYDRDEEAPVGILGRLSLDEKERTSASSYSGNSAASKTRMTRDDLAPLSPPRRSNTKPTAGSHGGAGGLPSPLSPSSPTGGAVRSVSDAKSMRRDKDATGKRQRICIRCERTIDQDRWVRTDTDKGVLCERCWKNMYLPKCRRCDEPIEKAAVFSSDGQLKGKYHRACFTCHVCRRPFPDKSFYVYDGHPLCEFHYHEANRSLCASRTCGRPVEGPCAVTEAGDRFHPGCLRCEYAGCGDRLEDYWEVGGKVLCERHAQRADDDGDEEEDGDTLGELPQFASTRRPPRLGSRQGRAQKRTTHLINLAGAF